MILLVILHVSMQRVEALPYSLFMDDGIAVILLCCFFLSAYVLSHSKKILFQLARDFFLYRERGSIFSTLTGADMRYLLLLLFQTCILVGVAFFCYFYEQHLPLVLHVSPLFLLGVYVGISILYFFLKWLLYLFIGWIFFDGSKTSVWLESYSTILYYLGFVLYPFLLAVIYFDYGLYFIITFALSLAIFVKLLMLYKWIKLFCANLHGSIFLILYFCALEIVPCFILYHGMGCLNEFMTIKF